jgi:peroxiredoxin
MTDDSTPHRAPPFELPNQKGQVRSLAEYLAGGPVLLVFHRGTW